MGENESIKGTVLQDLTKNRYAQMVRKCGAHSSKLETIGDFMKVVAKKIIAEISSAKPRSYFVERTRATSIRVLRNKTFEVTATIDKGPTSESKETQIFTFKTKSIILATGGLQV